MGFVHAKSLLVKSLLLKGVRPAPVPFPGRRPRKRSQSPISRNTNIGTRMDRPKSVVRTIRGVAGRASSKPRFSQC